VPLLRVLVLALALGQAIGISDFVDVACAEDCGEQDCDDGACPPICPSCHCATRLPVQVASSAASIDPPRPSASSAIFLAPDDAPPSPDPWEILHVPIAHIV
jgi:hypothetical protein